MTVSPTPPRKRGRRAQGPPPRFGAVLLVVGSAILLLGAWGALQGARTLRWPRAEATIIDSELRRSESEANRGSATAQYNHEYSYSFAAHYRYEVAGTEYVGGRVEPYDFGMQNSGGAQKMNDRHRVGSTVRVAYDPDNPSVAYLEPGPSSASLMVGAVGLIFATIGLWLHKLTRRGGGRVRGESVAS